MDKGLDTRLRKMCHWYWWRRIIPQSIQRNICLIALVSVAIVAAFIKG